MKTVDKRVGWCRLAFILLLAGVLGSVPTEATAQCGGLCHTCGFRQYHIDSYDGEWWDYPYPCAGVECPNSCVWAFSPEWDTEETVGLVDEFSDLVDAIDDGRYAVVAQVLQTQQNAHLNIERGAIQIFSGSDCQGNTDEKAVIAHVPLTALQLAAVVQAAPTRLASRVASPK